MRSMPIESHHNGSELARVERERSSQRIKFLAQTAALD